MNPFAQNAFSSSGGSFASISGTPTDNAALAAVIGINVKEYGALGDAKKVTDAASTNASTTVTSPSNPWTAADVGKVIWGVKTSTKALAVPLGTIATFVSAGQITVSVAATSTETNLQLVWGTNDTASIQAAHAAAMATEPRGVVIVPAGGYIFDEVLFDFTEASPVKSGGVLGAGSGSTIFYPSPAHDLAGTSMLAKTSGNNYYAQMQGFAVDGCYFEWAATFKNVIQLAGFLMETVRDVRIEFLYGVTDGIKALGYFTSLERVYVESSASYGVTLASGGSAFISDCVFANCINFSLNIDGVVGTTNVKSFVRVLNSWIDESGFGALYVTGSTDVVIQGVRVSGPIGYAGLQLASSSVVHAIGCELLPWGTTGNRPGVNVASGCVLHATNCRFDAAGTGNALTNAGTVHLVSSRLTVLGSGVALANTGTVNDVGGNVIASSSGTAAVAFAGRGANTFTALQQFSGTTHAGLRLNNLTTTQRDALSSPQAGMTIWNTTDARLQVHNGSAWTAGMVRLSGDAMTGPLSMPTGSAAAPSVTGPDPDSGVYFSANNQIDFSTGGTRRWHIDSTGTMQGGSSSLQLTGNTIGANYYARGGSYFLGSSDNVSIRTGSGSPEGVITAPIGTMYLRHTDGGAGSTLYVKESGTGNTGWAAK